MSVSVFAKNTCLSTGEGPYWEESTGCFLYVDIFEGDVHRWSTISDDDTKIHLGTDDTVTFIIPRTAGGYVVGLGRTILALDWDSEKVEQLCEVDHGTKNRFNTAKCDDSGRLWASTMGHESLPGVVDRHKGSLYSFDSDHTIKQHVDKLDLSNGMAWSLDNKIMYYIDSLSRGVYAYDFDLTTGSVSNQRTVFDFGEGTEKTLGIPAGMTIDHEGKLWVACYGGGKIIRFDPETGKQLQTVSIPATSTTSCCFGGPNYSELYVTTGRWKLTEEQEAQQPLAGSVFCVTGLGVHGFAVPTYNG